MNGTMSQRTLVFSVRIPRETHEHHGLMGKEHDLGGPWGYADQSFGCRLNCFLGIVYRSYGTTVR